MNRRQGTTQIGSCQLLETPMQNSFALFLPTMVVVLLPAACLTTVWQIHGNFLPTL
jgi:hypothetical protein